MKTTRKVTSLMVVSIFIAVGGCLSYVAWRAHDVFIDDIREKAFLLVHTFEAQMGPGFEKEEGKTNPVYLQNIHDIQSGLPEVREINVYRVSDQPSVVASSDGDQLGKAADLEDVEAAKTNEPVVLFGSEDGKGYIDVTAPLHHQGTVGYVMGVKVDIQKDLDSVTQILGQTLWLGLAALVLGALAILGAMGGMKRTLGAEPEDLKALVDRVALGDLEGFQGSQRTTTGVKKSLETMVAALTEKAQQIDRMAQGDFRVEVRVLSDQDRLARSLRTLVAQMNTTLAEVRQAMDEVAGGASQVRQASDSLSKTSADQASGLAEITATAQQLGDRTQENSLHAQNGRTLSQKALESARAGNASMTALVGAMEAIEASSANIGTVVKTIDDTVEGSRVVQSAAQSLADIAGGAEEVAGLIGDMAGASESQAEDLKQIIAALASVDELTQRNAATSEETASSAENLDRQVHRVQGLIDGFQLLP